MHPCLIYLEKLEYTLQIFAQMTSATHGYEFNELFLCVHVYGLGLEVGGGVGTSTRPALETTDRGNNYTQVYIQCLLSPLIL